MSTTKKIPSPLVSFLPIVLLIGMLFATIRTFGSDALSGGSQISLLTTTAVCVFIGVAFYRIPWRDYEIAITNNVAGVTSAIIILLIIGALSGVWMISGVLPQDREEIIKHLDSEMAAWDRDQPGFLDTVWKRTDM